MIKNITSLTSLGDLKNANYVSRSIKEELRTNLIESLKKGETVFKGIWGYEDTVIPELERAILSKHNINLLGLRGQAKTRLARLMIQLLDQWIPIVAGSEINDDPFNPISLYAKKLLLEKKDETPITWLHRDERFYEKLATPDVTVADLIGDIDPIKAANLKLSYADERVLHFGMVPRANRCIFVINELPDLQARIQVSLFNILQEGDIQIRGFKLRMPLDLQFVFTANPEDYTNRGSIVTPLKDRIGSQILTHYPKNIATAIKITSQEIKIDSAILSKIYIPLFAKELVEGIGFQARVSEFVDVKSGVSARMAITAMENLISTAEYRILLNNEKDTSIRVSDFMGVIPAITGKIELVYEGEQEGANEVALQLIENAVGSIFNTLFPKIEKLKHKDVTGPYDALVHWFFNNNEVEILNNLPNLSYEEKLNTIPELDQLISEYQPNTLKKDLLFLKELILWGLVYNKQLSKDSLLKGAKFGDNYGRFIHDL